MFTTFWERKSQRDKVGLRPAAVASAITTLPTATTTTWRPGYPPSPQWTPPLVVTVHTPCGLRRSSSWKEEASQTADRHKPEEGGGNWSLSPSSLLSLVLSVSSLSFSSVPSSSSTTVNLSTGTCKHKSQRVTRFVCLVYSWTLTPSATRIRLCWTCWRSGETTTAT